MGHQFPGFASDDGFVFFMMVRPPPPMSTDPNLPTHLAPLSEEEIRRRELFLRVLSHEVRTPLNAILGMATLLLESPLPEPEHEYAASIRSSGTVLLSLIDSILDLTALESGDIAPVVHEFNLHECVDDVAGVLAPEAASKGISFAVLIEPATPALVEGDMLRLKQILRHLVDNAIKFTADGEVLLSVHASEEPDGRHSFHFEVRDTGPGIPPSRIRDVFEPFSRLDTSLHRRHPGAGLGLPIARGLCAALGGRLDVTSTPGVGSVFDAVLPMLDCGGAFAYRAPRQEHLSGRTALCILPDALQHRVLSVVLRYWGMSTIPTTRDGAVSRIRSGEVADVVLALVSSPDDMPDELVALGVPVIRLLRATGGFHEGVALPLGVPRLHEALSAVLSFPESRDESEQGTFVRLLLVEDNIMNQKVALNILGRYGYFADVAGNGVEALAALTRTAYDIVLMDVQMPEMDGLEATREIHRRYKPSARPWIIALTANTLASDRQFCFDAGMNDFIGKPIDPQQLRDTMARAVVAVTARRENPPEDEVEIIDRSVLMQYLAPENESDATMLREVVRMYMMDIPIKMHELAEALARRDQRAVTFFAHNIQGSCAMLGAARLAAHCRQLAQEVSEEGYDRAMATMTNIGEEFDLLQSVLREMGQLE